MKTESLFPFKVHFPNGHTGTTCRRCVHQHLDNGKIEAIEEFLEINEQSFRSGARFNLKEVLKQNGFDPQKAISQPSGKSASPVQTPLTEGT